MADAVAVFPPGFRVLDSNGDPVPGAKINFYAAGTSNPLTVYSTSDLSTTSLGATVYCDAGGYPVASSGSSTKVTVYTGTAAYKVIITSSDDGTTYATLDNIRGATDTTGFGAVTTSWESPVSTKSADYTVLAADQDKLLDVDSTAASRTITLISAVTAGDGFRIGIRHNGTANVVKVASASSQSIHNYGSATDGIVLTGKGETVWLLSNGADWRVTSHVAPFASSNARVFTIEDRLSAPPGSPVSGGYYIVGASPSGDWASFSQHDIVQEDGGGGWIRITPPSDCGWIAWIKDEDLHFRYHGTSGWVSEVAAAARYGTTQVSSQFLMETGTSTDNTVLIGHQHYHPGHPKAWVHFDGAGTAAIRNDYGVASLTDNGTGDYTVTFDTAFSGINNYTCAGFAEGATNPTVVANPTAQTKSTTDRQIKTYQVIGTPAVGDADEVGLIFVGDFS